MNLSGPTRRQVLVGLVALPACSGKSADTADSAVICTTASTGADQTFCNVSALTVRIPGAAALTPGDALLANVDDNTAVILARDSAGFYARSGICTHACCIVALCTDATCSAFTTSPGACQTTQVVRPDPSGGIFCPCHGSTFALVDGSVTAAPARVALPSYAVTIDGNDVLVDTGTQVGPSARV